ncbi:MAG TPA: hypothetical protein VGD39_11675 [Nocardioides sp.]
MDDDRPDTGTAGAGEEVSLRLVILDAQVVDADDLPVGRVDDLDLDVSTVAGGGPRVAALLVGQRHLAPRIGGVTGILLGGLAHHLAHDTGGGRIDAARVGRWTNMPKLLDRLDETPAAGLEKWLSHHVVRHLPGADDAGL